MSLIMKGAPVAEAITAVLADKAEALKAAGREPALAIVRVGENGSDLSYERGAVKRCEKIGIRVIQIVLKADCTEAELLAEIEKINADSGIHGCLMFRPLPGHIDERKICEALAPAKDVDCITGTSLAAVFAGRGEGFAPCTAQACMEILDYYGIDPEGKRAAVIGRSLVIGKPVSMLLQARNATVTMCHTRTQNMADVCREADILVAAAGHINTVDPGFVHPGQVVLDVGINVGSDGRPVGDVDFEKVQDHVRAISPVPGGVGAVTTAVLCKHVIEAAEKAAGVREFRELYRRWLRKSRIAYRNSLTAQEIKDLSGRIVTNLIQLPEYRNAKNILLYQAVRSEASLRDLQDESKCFAYPLCISKTEMIALVPENEEAWHTGYCGISEPVREKSQEISPDRIDLVVCPCTAFDEKGGRMGMGGGFYDRYLPQCTNARFIAVAYEGQKAAQLPAEPWDMPMDIIVTEKKVYYRNKKE